MSLPQTFYAPAGRRDQTEVLKDFELISSNELTVSILNGIPTQILLLNEDRQIVFSNKAFLNLFQLKDISSILGLRPGEATNCPYAKQGPDGCGTSKNCHVCGAVKSILNSLASGSDTLEYTIMGDSNYMMHMNVTSELIRIENRSFILFSLKDISSEKKKAMLERLFFHDIMNTAHNISSMAELLASEDYQEEREEHLGYLMKSTMNLIDEINTHRIISTDNHQDYISTPVAVNTFSFFKDIKMEFRTVDRDNQQIILDERSQDFTFTVDKVLLKRVVTNMIKNALEAEDSKGQITIGMMAFNQNGAMIWVHNSSWMSEEVQMQVFRRSFSTKGPDRGLGTYSMKMLTEKFMKGKISFNSSSTNGTTFIIEIPGKDA